MHRLIAIILALATFSANAAEDKNWGLIADVNGGLKIHGKLGSFERYDGAGTLVVRFTSNTNKINFYIAGISDKTCNAGVGEVAFFDTNHNLLRREDYVQNGGNGIASIGDLLCYLINKKQGGNV